MSNVISGLVKSFEKFIDLSDTVIIGICGPQGSGKSTLAAALASRLKDQHQLDVLTLSLDDLYLTKEERQRLAVDVHPLLSTRGVPGTHDIPLACNLFANLKAASASNPVYVPRFNKAIDDRAPEADWTVVTSPPDLILFEGWCVGVPPQEPRELLLLVNDLEATDDHTGEWRSYVNEMLWGPYGELFSLINHQIYLQIPSFEQIYAWRGQQEADLAATNPDARTMTEEELKAFISHYERLTRHGMKVMPELADTVVTIDIDHQMTISRQD